MWGTLNLLKYYGKSDKLRWKQSLLHKILSSRHQILSETREKIYIDYGGGGDFKKKNQIKEFSNESVTSESTIQRLYLLTSFNFERGEKHLVGNFFAVIAAAIFNFQ